MLNTGSRKYAGYSFYWSGLKRNKWYGVGIAIRESSYITIESIITVNERMKAANINVKGFKVHVISCYAPTLRRPLLTKQKLYKDLLQLSKVEQKRKLIIQGDFNAELLICRMHTCFDGASSRPEEGLNTTNDIAMLFLQLSQTQELAILNSWFYHPIHHRVTWHHPNGTTRSVYDYSMFHSWLRSFVKDIRVRNSYFNSDHGFL